MNQVKTNKRVKTRIYCKCKDPFRNRQNEKFKCSLTELANGLGQYKQTKANF